MMTRTIEEISSLARIQIKEDARDNDNLLLKTCLEKVKSIGNLFWEFFEIEPEVEGRVGNGLNDEAHFTKTRDHVVAFVLFLVNDGREDKNENGRGYHEVAL
jgi:hypothetical protein